MSILPTWPIAAGTLVFGLAVGAYIDHTVMAARISEMKLDNATAITQASRVALEDYKAGAEVIADAALGNKAESAAILAQLAVIRRNQKNAPPTPLPADCKPGPVRLRNLAETATAADQAIARPVPRK